jgi:ribosomal protein S5
MTPGGRKRSQRAIVVVGNGNGAAGFAVGKGQSGISALKKVHKVLVGVEFLKMHSTSFLSETLLFI